MWEVLSLINVFVLFREIKKMKTNLKLFLIIYKTSYDSLMGDVD